MTGKFTKEEISLCKQVAEKHRKDIARGDYYVGGRDKKNRQILALSHEVLKFESLIPLWTISDCLEFLREKGYTLETHEDILPSKDVYIEVHKHIGEMDMGHIHGRGKTDLEACLKVVLVVLEGGK